MIYTYILYMTFINWLFFFFFFLAFLTSENDINCIVTLRHLSPFRHVMVRYNVRKELFPRLKRIFSLEKISFLFPSKITNNSIKNEISLHVCTC